MKNFNLKYDFNALCEIEDKTNMGIIELVNSPKLMYSTRVMLWGGMLHLHPSITLEEVGDMILEEIKKGKKLDEFSEIVVKSLTESGVLGNSKKDIEQEKN